jgi:molybdenum cofactor cytidylyltransferase
MHAQTIDIAESAGRVLSAPVFRPGGRKLLAKGHILRAEDVRVLLSEGMKEIAVTVLDENEVPEDEVVCAIAGEIACGSYSVQMAAGGRANLIASEDCCVLVDDDLLRQVNCLSGLVVASLLNFSYAPAGQRIATVKSAPFAVSRADFQNSRDMLRRNGPVLQARPVGGAAIAVLYTDPFHPERAKTLSEPVVRQKLERFGIRGHRSLSVLENEGDLARGMQRLLKSRPTALLVASTTAPAGPRDAVGIAMEQIGCRIERFLAPVEPGNLLLMGYHDGTPVVSVPGGFRSLKPNVLDLLIPPMMARYQISASEVARLGHGGLLN